MKTQTEAELRDRIEELEYNLEETRRYYRVNEVYLEEKLRKAEKLVKCEERDTQEWHRIAVKAYSKSKKQEAEIKELESKNKDLEEVVDKWEQTYIVSMSNKFGGGY